jgi:hypothetical protein
MDRRAPQSSTKDREEKPPMEPEIGGREFGQVIEPMQAEMASENEGLTDKQAAKPKESGMKKEKIKKEKPRKAA